MSLLIPDHSIFKMDPWSDSFFSDHDVDIDDADFLREIIARPRLRNRFGDFSSTRKRPYSRSLVNYNRIWPESSQILPTTPTIELDKNKFQVNLDIHQFKPDEIEVKLVDKFVTVDAKHEEQQDEHGWISRQFQRKYLIPDDCDLERVKTALSSDGVLTITVPKKAELTAQNERKIPIEITGKPAIREAEKLPDTDKEKKSPAKMIKIVNDTAGPKEAKRRKKDANEA